MSRPPRVLVTGGAGYIGSHAAKALRGAGFEPVTLDDLSTGHEWAVQFGPLVRGSIAEAVIHFAANAYVRESLLVPEKYFGNNTGGTIALLGACLKAKIRAFVLSSTCAVYGVPDRVPIVESARCEPINPYGESKRMIERMLEWYGRAHGLPWVALRYFNASGADPDGTIGEAHGPETHIVPLLLRAARGEGPISLFGTDHATPDGTAVRDYIHVSDLADAHVRALRYLLEGGASRAFNLGTGEGASIRDVMRAVERNLGRAPEFVVAPRSEGDPPILVADASASARELGWTPARSNLDSIIDTAARWDARRPSAG